MNLFWAVISFLLYIKIIIIILLTAPIISVEQWNRLFRHPVVDFIVHQIQAYFYIYMSVLLLLWFNSLRDMRLYSKVLPVSYPSKVEDSIALIEQKMNLYQAERNFFISGFSIFGTMLMSQLFKLFSKDNCIEIHIVDWSKAMVPQIHKIAEHYSEWVNKPVDRPLQLFEPWYLEMLTRTPWWIVPLFWIPIAAYLIYQESFINQNLHLKPSIIAMKFLSGILLWTFIEYTLHRWIFHINLKGKNPWLCTLHFMIHGLHHKVPFDHHRLVFPVFPAILIASVVYAICYYFLALSKITLAGGVCGYVCYDLMHYYLHYGDPKISLIYQLKRSHYQHHFVHHDRGFGVSSTIWDYVFGTRIFLRKLGFLIKWKFQSL